MPLTSICQTCGISFSIYPSEASTRKFCSRECRVIHPPRVCIYCGETYKPKGTDGIKYCSWACYRDYEREYKEQHTAELFWSRVKKSDYCWEWTGGAGDDGYGYYDLNGKRTRAHRFAYKLTFGTIPDDQEICHKCDNPSCVRPDHLFPGTSQDNRDDAATKGRIAHRVGSQIVYGGKKISDDQVRELITRYRSGGITQLELAQEYGLSRPFVSMLLSGYRRRIAIAELGTFGS